MSRAVAEAVVGLPAHRPDGRPVHAEALPRGSTGDSNLRWGGRS